MQEVVGVDDGLVGKVPALHAFNIAGPFKLLSIINILTIRMS
jgi:hypothetical protein